MTRLSFIQLVDIEQIRQLLEAQYKITGILSAILDTDENILVAVGWQDICTRFHRVHPVTCARCRESDAYIKAHLQHFSGEYLDYRCKNGLRDMAVPIIIGGVHLATLFTGQFFYDDEKPDIEHFRAQAEEFGFDTGDYLEALGRVPICSRDQIRNIMYYYGSLVKVMAETGLKNLNLTLEVAERKKAEIALQDSRDYLDKIINSIADPIFVKDREHRLVLVNDAECALAGRSREELIGRTDYDFFPKEQVDVFWEKDEIVFATEQENINEESITDARGRIREILTKKSLYKGINGERYIVGIIRDISELKQKERELQALNEELENRVAQRTSELGSLNADLLREIEERRQAEQRLELLNFALDHVREEAYLVDEQARFRYVNEGACRVLGYGRDEFLTMKVSDIDPDYQPDGWSDHWREVRKKGCITFETRHRSRDGRIYPIEITVSYFEYEGSEYVLGLARDITERKRAEEEIKIRQRQMEELNETLEKRVEEELAENRAKDIMLIQQNRQAALGEMFDHIAHQWKQPINTISLIIQDLEETASCGELTEEYVSGVVRKTYALLEHMAQTIDVFRDFYRPVKEKSVFRIKDSIDMAVGFIAPALRLQSVAVEIDVDPGLLAVGYPKEYAQVLMNLLGNARNALVDGKIEKPRVQIRAFAEERTAVVTITDNAGGIPEMNLDRIFEPFFTTRKMLGGTGVGLYMSKNIIENSMGGTLSVANIEGGAQFRIEIPVS
ncbi:MAG TPA: PocR ligand-binding domain-containing protein [Geobacteraceae bacterium]|nr:PocR ligand-binding domain-containing protein [Geobacteraceae bacterium]